MKKYVALVAALAALGSSVAMAGAPAKGEKKAPTKMAEYWTCPIMGGAVHNKKDKGVVFENAKVHFCCGGCPSAWTKMTTAQKREKVAMLKKAAEKSGDKGGVKS